MVFTTTYGIFASLGQRIEGDVLLDHLRLFVLSERGRRAYLQIVVTRSDVRSHIIY
jgi:hypothetical protein